MPSAPPALPPKKSRSLRGSSKRNKNANATSNAERIIPIVRESDGAVITPRNNITNFSKRCSTDSLLHSKRCSTESAGSISAGSSNSVNSSLIGDKESDSGWPKRPVNSDSSQRRIPSPPLISNDSPLENEAPSVTASSPTSSCKATPSRTWLHIADDSPLNKAEHVAESLIYANNAEGILELRAGDSDELIILATQSTNRDFVYQDAFLLTHRTFISTLELLHKLEYRFRRFNCVGKADQLKAARSSFSLLVSQSAFR